MVALGNWCSDCCGMRCCNGCNLRRFCCGGRSGCGSCLWCCSLKYSRNRRSWRFAWFSNRAGCRGILDEIVLYAISYKSFDCLPKGALLMQKEKFILCPVCGNKTRVQIREDTELKNFPLFCPKCHKQTLINAKQLNITKAEVPDAKTQSR